MSFSPLKLGLGLPYSGFVGGLDPDAKAYIAAVEAADAQTLESGVKKAINNFVVGCKSDGIWDAIKASCILAGARTLSGALVPLKGTAPTNFNFVSGDYNRETGLKGSGSAKYLDSNRNNNTDPQNSFSMAVYITAAATTGTAIGAGGADVGASTLTASSASTRNRSGTISSTGLSGATGLTGHSRASSTGYTRRAGGSNTTVTEASQSPMNSRIAVFGTFFIGVGVAVSLTDARISFYSIGESLDLADLDARVSTLITEIDAAIP